MRTQEPTTFIHETLINCGIVFLLFAIFTASDVCWPTALLAVRQMNGAKQCARDVVLGVCHT